MTNSSSALISISPKYVRAIVEGRKTVEVRRSPTKLSGGETLWIYSTSPAKRIEARATVKCTFRISPAELWRRFSKVIGITRAELFEYAKGCKEITAIVLEAVVDLARGPSLGEIRKKAKAFHPPQFLVYISNEHPLANLLDPQVNSRKSKVAS